MGNALGHPTSNEKERELAEESTNNIAIAQLPSIAISSQVLIAKSGIRRKKRDKDDCSSFNTNIEQALPVPFENSFIRSIKRIKDHNKVTVSTNIFKASASTEKTQKLQKVGDDYSEEEKKKHLAIDSTTDVGGDSDVLYSLVDMEPVKKMNF